MQKEIIWVNEFCIHHQIEFSFVESLAQSGLIEIQYTGEKACIPQEQLPELEKLMRLYYDMDINLEGIETITYLLQKMNSMQEEITALKNKLYLYESE